MPRDPRKFVVKNNGATIPFQKLSHLYRDVVPSPEWEQRLYKFIDEKGLSPEDEALFSAAENQKKYEENPQRLANEELLRNLQNKISSDQASLMNTGYPVYKGQTVAPMSAMTQNARLLREQTRGKPAPKSRKVAEALGRPKEGLSREQTQNLLGMLRRGETSENLVLNRLNKEFGQNFGYERGREQNIKDKVSKDIRKNLDLSQNNIRNFSNELGILEGKKNLHGAASLQRAGQLKEGRREGLINQLEEFGNQKHAFDNLKVQADRDVFNEEKMAPYRKINRAQQALQGIDVDEMHPDKMSVQNQMLQKIANAYNAPHVNYPGERVVGISPETEVSYSLANQINPKYRDVFRADRKNIERDLLGENIATKAYNKVPEAVEPLMGNLDALAKKQLKKETKQIGGKHVRLGTYGSGVHKAETEKALREIMKRVQGEREGVLLSGLKGEAKLVGKGQENALNEYNFMADLGNKEFQDILRQNALLNRTGNTKWSNKQNEENENLKSWYGQLNHEWPMMQKQLSNQGYEGGRALGNNSIVSPFSEMAKGYNTDLASLFAQPALFSENQKALNEYSTDAKRKLKSQVDYYRNQQIELANQNRIAVDQATKEAAARMERERQNALKSTTQLQMQKVPPRVSNVYNNASAKRQDLWDYFDWTRKLGMGEIPLPQGVSPHSSLAVGTPPHNIAKWISPSLNYPQVTQPMLFEAYDRNPSLPFGIGPSSNWRKEYGV